MKDKRTDHASLSAISRDQGTRRQACRNRVLAAPPRPGRRSNQPGAPRREGKPTDLVGANFVDDPARLAHTSSACHDYIRLLHHKSYSYVEHHFDRDPLLTCVSVRIAVRAQLTSQHLGPYAR
jgi:hypothetical protein